MSNYSFEMDSGWRDARSLVKEVEFIVLAVLIIAVNSCVIITVWRKRILHKWQNYLLVSLACSDLSTGLLGLPLALLCTVASPKASCILCSVTFIFTKFISISTILHLLTITYERFLYIVYPFHHDRLSAKRCHFKLVLAANWFISLSVASAPLVWVRLVDCFEKHKEERWLIYAVITLILFFLVPMILFIFAFVSIFSVARAHIRTHSRLRASMERSRSPTHSNTTHRKEARVVIIFALMWSVFVICWGPYFTLSILDELQVEIDVPEKLREAANVLRFLTSLLNPFLYSFLKKDFCQALAIPFFCERDVACCCCFRNRKFVSREEMALHSNTAQQTLLDTPR